MGPTAQNNLSPRLDGKTLLVLGAGYLGTQLALQGRREGAHVTTLTRNRETAERLEQMGFSAICADLAEHNWHRAAGCQVDIVVFCVSSGGGGLDDYRRNYVEGMRSVARWLQSARVGCLISTSSTSVYPQDGGELVNERSWIDVNRLPVTSLLLLEAETLMKEACHGAHRRCILRLAGLYGPGRHLMLDQIASGAQELMGRAEQHLNLVHRDDVVQAILRAACQPVSGDSNQLFNVVDDGAATRGEIVTWLARRLQCPAPRYSGMPSTRGSTDRVISNEKIKRLLGWIPLHRSFREGYEAILGERRPVPAIPLSLSQSCARRVPVCGGRAG